MSSKECCALHNNADRKREQPSAKAITPRKFHIKSLSIFSRYLPICRVFYYAHVPGTPSGRITGGSPDDLIIVNLYCVRVVMKYLTPFVSFSPFYTLCVTVQFLVCQSSGADRRDCVVALSVDEGSVGRSQERNDAF